MSDLKTRIGRKAHEFPNKTWVRPGLQIKRSPKRGLLVCGSPETKGENGSDFLSHEYEDFYDEYDDSHSNRSGTPPNLSTFKPALLARMSMGPAPLQEYGRESTEKTQGGHQEKSLLERVSYRKQDDDSNSQSSSMSAGGIYIGPGLDDGKAISNKGQAKMLKQIRSEPRVAQLPVSNETTTANEYDSRTNNQPQSPRASNRIENNQDEEQDPHRSTGCPLQNGPNQAPESLPSSISHGIKSNLPTPMPHKCSQSSSSEDGELRVPSSSDQVRAVLLPLMLHNADSRIKHAKPKINFPQTGTFNPKVLTDEACSSFAGKLEGFQKELKARELQRTASFPGTDNAPILDDRKASVGTSNVALPPRPSSPTSRLSSALPNTFAEKISRGDAGLSGQPAHTRTSRFSNGVTSTSDAKYQMEERHRNIDPFFSYTSNRGETSKRISSTSAAGQHGEIRRNWQSPTSHPNNELKNASTMLPHASSRLEDRRGSQPSTSYSSYKPMNATPPPPPATSWHSEDQHRNMHASTSYTNHNSQRPYSPTSRRDPTERGYQHRRSLSPVYNSRRGSYSTRSRPFRRGVHSQERYSPDPDTPAKHRPYPPPSPPSPTKRGYNRSPKSNARSLSRDSISETRHGFPPSKKEECEKSREHSYTDRRVTRSPRRRGYSGDNTRRSASPVRRDSYRSYPRRPIPPRRSSPTPSPPQNLPKSRGRSPLPERRPRSNERMDKKDRTETRDWSKSSRTSTSAGSNTTRPTNMVIHEEVTGQRRPSSSLQNNLSIQDRQEHAPRQSSLLPCHNVPGLWFLEKGLDRVGTLSCKITIDHETAVRWNISQTNSEHLVANRDPIQESRKRLTLQICSFPHRLVDDVKKLKQGTFHAQGDYANAIFALGQSWPTQGHLTIIVNPDNEKRQAWLPQDLGTRKIPIHIERYLHEGENVVQFLQLSGMAENVFGLYASETFEDPSPFLPMKHLEDDTDLTVDVRPGSVTIFEGS